jgi:hypothetical protein
MQPLHEGDAPRLGPQRIIDGVPLEPDQLPRVGGRGGSISLAFRVGAGGLCPSCVKAQSGFRAIAGLIIARWLVPSSIIPAEDHGLPIWATQMSAWCSPATK